MTGENAMTEPLRANIETITPAMALAILQEQERLEAAAGHALNRRIHRQMVSLYAAQMRDGGWMLNGEPIIFNGPRLLDGQTRLSAIVESGATIQMLVVRGVNSDAFMTIDNGAKRTASDVLGVFGVRNQTQVAGAAALVMIYQGHGHMESSGTARPAPSDVVRFVTERDHDFQAAHAAVQDAHKAVGAPSVLVAISYLARKRPSLRHDFFAGLKTGAGLDMTSPVRVLREALLSSRRHAHTARMNTRAAWVIKAWNAAARKQEMKLLRWNSDVESFPVMITDY